MTESAQVNAGGTQPPIDARDYWLGRAVELLSKTLAKWEDEECSVKKEKAAHIRELNAFFGDWDREKMSSPVPLVVRTLQGYARLHDGLSDMIEGGRLSADDIPDDYEWLVDALANLGSLVDDAIEEARVAQYPARPKSDSAASSSYPRSSSQHASTSRTPLRS